MATKFQIKRSLVSGVVPTTGDISPGELAVNLADKKLYTANSTATFELGSNLTNLSVTGNLSVLALFANGSLGAPGQILASNGTGTHWISAGGTGTVTSVDSGNGLAGGPITGAGTLSVLANTGIVANSTGVHVNTSYFDAIYSSLASPTFTGTVTLPNIVINGAVTANSSNGTAGQILTSNGSTVYWSTPSTGFTNGQSISVNDLNINGSVSIDGSTGTAGQVLTTDGTTTYWSTVVSNDSISAVVSQQFTANGTQNSFSVSGGYIPYAIEVYVNGVKQIPAGVDVIVSSGSSVNFIIPPGNNDIVDVFGFRPAGNLASFVAITGDTMEGNLAFSTNAVIIANGSLGTPGQVLTSNGSAIFWSSAGFSNGQSITVNNFVITGSFTANSSTGNTGDVLRSNGSSVYWSAPASTVSPPYALISANTSANMYGKYIIDTTVSNVHVTLPATANAGDYVIFADGGGDKSVKPVFILRNGLLINGATSDLEVDVPDFKIEVVYTGVTWKVFT